MDFKLNINYNLISVVVIHCLIHLTLHIRQTLDYVTLGHLHLSKWIYPAEMLIHYFSYRIVYVYSDGGLRDKNKRVLHRNLFSIISLLYGILCYLGLYAIENHECDNGYFPFSYFVTTIMEGHMISMVVGDTSLQIIGMSPIVIGIGHCFTSYLYLGAWLWYVPYSEFMVPNHILEYMVTTSLLVGTVVRDHFIRNRLEITLAREKREAE